MHFSTTAGVAELKNCNISIISTNRSVCSLVSYMKFHQGYTPAVGIPNFSGISIITRDIWDRNRVAAVGACAKESIERLSRSRHPAQPLIQTSPVKRPCTCVSQNPDIRARHPHIRPHVSAPSRTDKISVNGENGGERRGDSQRRLSQTMSGMAPSRRYV
jgi:hypothetical protein